MTVLDLHSLITNVKENFFHESISVVRKGYNSLELEAIQG